MHIFGRWIWILEKLPGAELTSDPASVASIFLAGRVQLTISLAINAHLLVNRPNVRGWEKKKERSSRLLVRVCRYVYIPFAPDVSLDSNTALKQRRCHKLE
jgi:hypothetical protein